MISKINSEVAFTRYFSEITGFIIIKLSVLVEVHPSTNICLGIAIGICVETNGVISVTKTICSEKIVSLIN